MSDEYRRFVMVYFGVIFVILCTWALLLEIISSSFVRYSVTLVISAVLIVFVFAPPLSAVIWLVVLRKE